MELIEAIVENNVGEVKKLLAQGVDPNICLDEAKVRPLHFAAQENNVEIGKLLIAAGADMHATTEPDDETPLDIARLHNNQEFIDLLMEYKAPTAKVN